MARPKKATVDYFPHMTDHGKTMFILESKWGNDGYAVWFKMLEKIGSSEGLFIDCRDIATWSYLTAYCRVPEQTLTEIIEVLANINAIDRELWLHKLIYCQHLVDNVADAFSRRKEKLPSREIVIANANITLTEFMYAETPINPVNDDISTEREREREREREIIEESVAEPPPGDKSPPPSLLKDLWNEVVKSPAVKEFTKARAAKCRVRLQERSLDEWRVVFQRVKESPFCQGDNDRGWRADFDWITKSQETAARVLEGKYSNNKVKPTIQASKGVQGTLARIEELRARKAAGGNNV